MRTTVARFLRLAVLVHAMLLGACGGGNPAPVLALADPAQPAQPSPAPTPAPPAAPAPPTPPAAPDPSTPLEPVLAAAYTAWSNDTLNSPPGWRAWVAPPDRSGASGVGCLLNEAFHRHALLSIYKEGVRQGLPENIGRGGCTYELHTHDRTGVVHIETDVPKRFTLGQFFALWSQALGPNGTAGLAGPVRFYVIENEKLTRQTGDPAALDLVAHREIVIVSGAAPPVLPRYRWPADL